MLEKQPIIPLENEVGMQSIVLQEDIRFGLSHPHLAEHSYEHPHVAHAVAHIEDSGFVFQKRTIETAKKVVKKAETIFQVMKKHPIEVAATTAVVFGVGATATAISLRSSRA